MDTDVPPTDPAPSVPSSESKDEKEDTPLEQQGDDTPDAEGQEPPVEEKMEVNGNPESETTNPQSSDPKPDPQTEEGGAQVEGGGAQATPDTSSTKQPTPKKQKKTFKQIDLPVDENTSSLKKKYLDDAFEKEVGVV